MTRRRKSPPPRPFEPRAVARSDDADAFIPDPGGGPAVVDDDLAESLAEEFVEDATSGQDPDEQLLDGAVPEEIGGPFVETTAAEELAYDVDANNPPGTVREPLPRAVAGIVTTPEVDRPTDEDDDDEVRDARGPQIR
jgi:hypothetical protein